MLWGQSLPARRGRGPWEASGIAGDTVGGFIGVDIFFVISGYLIINQIAEDIENKRFSILDFAMRRTFRILPALLLVMVVCLALSTTIFMQAERKDFAESFFLSAIMFANHHFLSTRVISTRPRSRNRCFVRSF